MHHDAAVRPADRAPAARDYIQTTATGNAISRRAAIYGASNIVLGGKCIVAHRAVVRGDLQRTARGGEDGPRTAIAITVGRYVRIGERAVLRPAARSYQGHVAYFPLRIGSYVDLGADSVIEAAQVGSYVEIGAKCVVGIGCVIRDCAVLRPGAVLPPGTVVPSMTVWGGAPARMLESLPESFQEACEGRARTAYGTLQAALGNRP